MCSAVDGLVGEVLTVLRQAGLAGQALDLQRGAAAATPSRPAAERAAARSPAADVAAAFLPAALSAAQAGAAGRLGSWIAELSGSLRWTQTANYVASPPHDRFLARYAHAAVLGPPEAAAIRTDETRSATLGVLLLGPENVYPHHRHPADEVYIPVTDASWSSGLKQPWRHVQPGQPLHHRPHQPHATRTAGQSLLTVYLWTGDTTTAARLCVPPAT
jgi:quercetin dioxygenase-like cupin family protein